MCVCLFITRGTEPSFLSTVCLTIITLNVSSHEIIEYLLFDYVVSPILFTGINIHIVEKGREKQKNKTKEEIDEPDVIRMNHDEIVSIS